MRAWLVGLVLAAAVLLASCGQRAVPSAAGEKPYAAKGVVEHLSDDRHLVTIQHEAIPGYMPGMTMDFPVRDEHLLDGVGPGDEVDFTLKVTQGDAWVAAVTKTGHVEVPNAPPTNNSEAHLKPGDMVPDATFLAEDGRTLRLSDFRGKVVAFTFFFTRCPLPNYCPLMNRNFAKTRELLLANSSAPRNWQFLSISFDSEFDQPQTLAAYAKSYRGDNPDHWLFVSIDPSTLGTFAAPLGLVLMRSDTTISHNLRTVVVDTQGRLSHEFNDNTWTPEELVKAIEAAAPAPGH